MVTGSEVQNLLQQLSLCLKRPPTSFREIASDLVKGDISDTKLEYGIQTFKMSLPMTLLLQKNKNTFSKRH